MDIIKKVAKTFVVNYNFSREDALACGKFKCVNLAIKDGTFPIGKGDGKKTLVGDLVGGLGCCRNTAEAQTKLTKKLKERGFGERPMTIREFAVFVGTHPQLCKNQWIGILGSVGKYGIGHQCVAYFYGLHGRWFLNFRLVRRVWDGRWDFAVVSEYE